MDINKINIEKLNKKELKEKILSILKEQCSKLDKKEKDLDKKADALVRLSKHYKFVEIAPKLKGAEDGIVVKNNEGRHQFVKLSKSPNPSRPSTPFSEGSLSPLSLSKKSLSDYYSSEESSEFESYESDSDKELSSSGSSELSVNRKDRLTEIEYFKLFGETLAVQPIFDPGEEYDIFFTEKVSADCKDLSAYTNKKSFVSLKDGHVRRFNTKGYIEAIHSSLMNNGIPQGLLEIYINSIILGVDDIKDDNIVIDLTQKPNRAILVDMLVPKCEEDFIDVAEILEKLTESDIIVEEEKFLEKKDNAVCEKLFEIFKFQQFFSVDEDSEEYFADPLKISQYLAVITIMDEMLKIKDINDVSTRIFNEIVTGLIGKYNNLSCNDDIEEIICTSLGRARNINKIVQIAAGVELLNKEVLADIGSIIEKYNAKVDEEEKREIERNAQEEDLAYSYGSLDFVTGFASSGEFDLETLSPRSEVSVLPREVKPLGSVIYRSTILSPLRIQEDCSTPVLSLSSSPLSESYNVESQKQEKRPALDLRRFKEVKKEKEKEDKDSADEFFGKLKSNDQGRF